MASFGELLRRYRGLQRLTQEELAERSGLSTQAVSLLERDLRRWPRSTSVESLARALELDAPQHEALVSAARRRPAETARSARPPVVPRELPRPPADFTGRTRELATLLRLLEPAGVSGGPPVVCAIDGMGGIGKSALAIQAAHALSCRFPDGQLYVDLQGAAAGPRPLEPAAVLGRLLRSLGLDAGAIPAALEEAAVRFRSLAAGRRLLLVLDNAAGTEQVRPLLPGGAACAVLVTSRQPLVTLEGAHALHLDVLGDEEALELLGRIAGDGRVAGERAAAVEVVRACGRLPLAIRIAGARLAARPAWPVRDLGDRLADAARRLETLRSGDLAVRTSFDVSRRALEESGDPDDRAAAAAFGLLGLPDGPDLGAAAAARLLDRPVAEAQALLERLVDARLLDSPRAGRYRFHDLVRLYAREHAARGQSGAARRAALLRHLGFFLDGARATSRVLGVADGSDAPGWLETERANLVAAIEQVGRFGAGDGSPELDERACELAGALRGFFLACGHWDDWARANEAALAIARRRGDLAGQAAACRDLGRAHERLGRFEQAIACQRASLDASREAGDRAAEAEGLVTLSSIHGRMGRYRAAMRCLQHSLRISRELRERRLEASGLGNLGCVHERLGEHERAIACHRESLAIFEELGLREGQARALNNLARALACRGRVADAIACAGRCVEICREVSHREGEAESLNTLGTLYSRVGGHERAIACQREGLATFRRLGLPGGELAALRDLGDALWAAGRREEARETWREGVDLAALLPLPQADEIRARLASTVM